VTAPCWVPAELERFSWFTRERYAIKLKRDAGRPRPWTEDPILAKYHFNNVFRGDDKTTQVILEVLQEAPDGVEQVRRAVLCRLINKASTIRPALAARGRGPDSLLACLQNDGINTQAYRINTPRGLNNLQGIVELGWDPPHSLYGQLSSTTQVRSLKDAHAVMRQYPFLVGFIGYQILLDLLAVGFWWPSFDASWVLAGPGAERGLRLLQGQPVDYDWQGGDFRRERRPSFMRSVPGLLADLTERLMQDWPAEWPPLTVHETEFMLCELDKYTRKLGAARPSGRLYRGS
jgi:hypothetical protein